MEHNDGVSALMHAPGQVTGSVLSLSVERAEVSMLNIFPLYAHVRVPLVLLVIASALFVSVAQANPERPVRQGLFYDSPSDGTSTSTSAQRAQLVIFTRGKIGYVRDLRRAGFRGKAVQYLMANEVHGPGPYSSSSSWCDSSFSPSNNQVAYNTGDFCKYIHPNESWFLHNGQGKRLYGKRSSGVMYHMNPNSSGWREFHRQRIMRDLVGDDKQSKIGFDGIYLDNVALRRYKLQKQLANSDGTVKEFWDDASYRTAVRGQLESISSKVRPVGPLWANLIDDYAVSAGNYLPLARQLDGFLNESWAMAYPGRDPWRPERWNEVLKIAETNLSEGRQMFAVVQGDKWDTTRQTFGLASYLLIARDGRAVFRYANAKSYREWWQYNNYNVALGAPKGARYEKDGKWRRNFQCGYVEVDPAARTAKISTSGC